MNRRVPDEFPPSPYPLEFQPPNIMNLRLSIALSLVLVLLMPVSLTAAPAAGAIAVPEFQRFPAGAAPAEVGLRVAENFLARPFEWQEGKRKAIIYPEICTWYGALTTAHLTGAADLQAKAGGEIRRVPPSGQRRQDLLQGPR